MLRRLALIFTIISLFFLPLFFAPTVSAIEIGEITTPSQLDDYMSQNNNFEKNLQDFCAKRQGNQMNLETWYSGKCQDDTFSGEGVGFSDIVILDLAEKLTGKKDPSQTFSKTLIELIKTLNDKKFSYATPEEQQLAINSARQKLFYSQDNGLLGQTGKMIGMLFQNQPASTTSYLAYVSQNLQKHHVIPETFAASAGIGFTTFSPFLTIWIAFRNLAYLGLIIFFIVYGFMMMFRVNLGQKTVISIQLAIPKLIVTLLLITFSYAIVGLMFDLMWVVIFFIIGYLGSQGLIYNGPVWHPATLAGGYGGILVSFVINALVAGPAAIFGILSLILGGTIGGIGTILVFVTGVIGPLISLIIIIAVLISYVKLFFKLISAFISVIISLITAPLLLLGNAFPGSQVIGTWFRSVLANLSVFPVTMILLLFSYMLMVQPILGIFQDFTDIFNDVFNIAPKGNMHIVEQIFGVKSLVALGETNIADVPLITPPWVGFSARGLLALIGVGLLLMASKYVDIVRDALKVPPFKYGTDIGGALKGGWQGIGVINPEVSKAGWYKKASKYLGATPGESFRTPPPEKDVQVEDK